MIIAPFLQTILFLNYYRNSWHLRTYTYEDCVKHWVPSPRCVPMGWMLPTLSCFYRSGKQDPTVSECCPKSWQVSVTSTNGVHVANFLRFILHRVKHHPEQLQFMGSGSIQYPLNALPNVDEVGQARRNRGMLITWFQAVPSAFNENVWRIGIVK